jgi:hypothetical protein
MRQTQKEIQRLDDEIKRVHSRMFRWANKLDKLIKARGRIEKRIGEIDDERKPIATPVDLPKRDPVKPDETTAALQALTGVVEKPDLDIPTFLARGMKAQHAADEAAKAAILAEQEAKRKVKAKASSEKSRAKRRGELRKMPLQGKAALALINESK